MAEHNEVQRRVRGHLVHAAVRSQSPDDQLLTVYMVAAEIIYANYPEDAHELLAEMARHDVFACLLDLAIEHGQERNNSLGRVA